MARNRKKPPPSIRVGPWVKAALLCLFFGGSGIGYVWQKRQIHELGMEIRKRELNLELRCTENERLKQQWNELRSPRKVWEQLRRLDLHLGLPQPEQILRLPDLPMMANPGTRSPGSGRAVVPARHDPLNRLGKPGRTSNR